MDTSNDVKESMVRTICRNFRKFGSTTRTLKDLKRINDHFNDEAYELEELKGNIPKKDTGDRVSSIESKVDQLVSKLEAITGAAPK